MKLRYMLLGAILPLIAGAQGDSAEKVTKVVHVKTEPTEIERLLEGSNVVIRGANNLHTIVIRGTAADVAAAESSIRQIDQAGEQQSAGKNVELTVYMLGGLQTPLQGNTEDAGQTLEPVIRQLRSLFPYKTYQLLGSMLIRSGQDSPTNSSGTMKTLQNPPDKYYPTECHVGLTSASLSAEQPSVVHLKAFSFYAKVPFLSGNVTGISYQNIDVRTQADIDIREGQKVVVGKLNLGNADDSLFLVLTARLVQ